MSTTSPSATPVPLHIAADPPPPPTPFAPAVLGSATARTDRPGPTPKPTETDWAALGAEPRWKQQETGDCAAILSPVLGPATGSQEYSRYAAGARRRSESILVVACTGAGERHWNLFEGGTVAPGIHLPDLYSTITAMPLPDGARAVLADGLDNAEHELGARLLNRPPATWFRLQLVQAAPRSGRDGSARIMPKPPAPGALRPILVDGLGDPVAAVWVPADGSARWFVVPYGTDLPLLTTWLVEHALPAYVPGALTRARSPLVRDAALATDAETRLIETIAQEQRDHEVRQAELQQELDALRAVADPLRDGLLFGTDRQLEDAVRDVLVAAGARVTRLDDVFDKESADLLAEHGGRRVLVEVKSSGNRPPQNLPDKLTKHLKTWPNLPGTEPVDGGVLVVNHQRKHPPAQRDAKVYTDRAFAEGLDVPVIGSTHLFEWWRRDDWEAVRRAFFGSASEVRPTEPADERPAGPAAPDTAPSPDRPSGLLGRWRR